MLSHAHQVGGVNNRLAVWEHPSWVPAFIYPVSALIDGHDGTNGLLLTGRPVGHVWSKLTAHVLDWQPIKIFLWGLEGCKGPLPHCLIDVHSKREAFF